MLGSMAQVQYLEIRCKTAIQRVQRMPFHWSLNPYAGCRHSCHFCYARAFYAKADHGDPHAGFETNILVKVNFPQVLERELDSRRWRGESIALGTATDPYQPADGRYRITRRVLEALLDHANPVSMLTKSPLVVRDVDVLAALAGVAEVRVTFSITTVDLALWRSVEPGTANPFRRLEAMQRLREAGVCAGVFMAPVLPGITDSVASIEAVAAAARQYRAASFGAIPLRLMPVVKEHFLSFIAATFPELLPRYERAYPGASAPADYRHQLERRIRRVREQYGFGQDAMRVHRQQPAPPGTLVRPRGRQLALPG
jgi:DNA repair photolyase